VTTIQPTGHILGATVRGLDLADPLSSAPHGLVVILSNIIENGEPIGITDAGQGTCGESVEGAVWRRVASVEGRSGRGAPDAA